MRTLILDGSLRDDGATVAVGMSSRMSCGTPTAPWTAGCSEALAEGRPVTRKAMETMAKPMMPARAYRLLGNRGFRSREKTKGTAKNVTDRPPYESSGPRDDPGALGPLRRRSLVFGHVAKLEAYL